MLRKRTLGRELALKYLFSIDLGRENNLESFDSFSLDQEKNADIRAFAHQLCQGVITKRDELVRLIEESTKNWTWKRMPVVDRCLLLLGAWELTSCPDIPATVTINEVVEMAKKFSTASSGSFVNGVLDTIRQTCNES